MRMNPRTLEDEGNVEIIHRDELAQLRAENKRLREALEKALKRINELEENEYG